MRGRQRTRPELGISMVGVLSPMQSQEHQVRSRGQLVIGKGPDARRPPPAAGVRRLMHRGSHQGWRVSSRCAGQPSRLSGQPSGRRLGCGPWPGPRLGQGSRRRHAVVSGPGGPGTVEGVGPMPRRRRRRPGARAAGQPASPRAAARGPHNARGSSPPATAARPGPGAPA